MKEKYKVLIAHSAQQHSFRTATALKENGYLYKYITTVYDKEESLTSRCKKVLKGDNLRRANSRRCNKLDDNDVIQYNEFLGLVLLLLQRIDKSKFIYNFLDRYIIWSFNKKVAKYAIKNNVDVLIMYDTLALKTFKILKKKSPSIKLVLDMSAPNIEYMEYIFANEHSKSNIRKDQLQLERMTNRYKRTLKNGIKEIKLADYYIVASEFTKKSLLFSNVEEKKIFKCIYGIDKSIYKYENNIKSDMIDKIKCIFIGSVNSRKGAQYLFNAIDRIDLSKFSFKFLGTYDEKYNNLKEYINNCEFLGHVTKDKVIKELKEADIIIFPSLADGFGLSVLEALACGTIAICSENAGVSELIEDYYNGFVIAAMNSEEIYNKLMWVYNNKNQINKLKQNAISSADKYKWCNYNYEIKKSIDSIMNK